MVQFSIADIENLTNIKAHTLRIWEQRYPVFKQTRRPSGHRVYSSDDLKQLLRIAWLYHNGCKISEIMSLSEDEQRTKALGVDQNNLENSQLVNQLLEASIDLDEIAFSEVADSVVLSYGFKKAMLDVFFPFLNKVGLFWLTGHITPAQEHFASYTIMRKLIVAIDKLTPVRTGKGRLVLLFTPVGETHELPLLLIQGMLKQAGVRILYAGVQVDTKTLNYLINYKGVKECYFNLITNSCKPPIQELFDELSAKNADVEFYFSANSYLLEGIKNPPNFHYLKSPADIDAYIETIIS